MIAGFKVNGYNRVKTIFETNVNIKEDATRFERFYLSSSSVKEVLFHNRQVQDSKNLFNSCCLRLNSVKTLSSVKHFGTGYLKLLVNIKEDETRFERFCLSSSSVKDILFHSRQVQDSKNFFSSYV